MALNPCLSPGGKLGHPLHVSSPWEWSRCGAKRIHDWPEFSTVIAFFESVIPNTQLHWSVEWNVGWESSSEEGPGCVGVSRWSSLRRKYLQALSNLVIFAKVQLLNESMVASVLRPVKSSL